MIINQTHKDLPGLEWAKECMVDIAQYINEVKRDSDTLQIMNDVQVIIINIDYCKKRIIML